MRRSAGLLLFAALLLSCVAVRAEESLRPQLDAPLLFVKRHAYMAGHIYDDYITWHPGGGIYVIENPWEKPEQHKVRAVIDPHTKQTLGEGVYRDPELSWDARRIVFAFKGHADGDTSIHEIGIDGAGLRQLTQPDQCEVKQGISRIGAGHHDITPCYLPDGRIVFSSTRPGALVPCFNSGVDTLHVMNADGSGLRHLSVNNVNEFDPAVLHDGRILYGRWEYVDKTALYMQSLWTISPDGRMEEALFANNLAKPTAVLDARPVPESHLIAAALTPHNGQAVGTIVMIDPRKGKNDLGAVANFTPEYPIEMDQGLTHGPSDPWPLSEDVLLIANNAKGKGVIQILDRFGHRELVHADPDFDCYSPMLIKPREKPPTVTRHTEASGTQPGRFLLSDIYQGLDGVAPGTIKRLRVVEETARVSGLPPGGRWWNQAFLVSWQGAYIVKNILGTVPVYEDGSAYFEVPAGKAVYFEALDAEGREIQRMRTHVQAAPGVTRSCVGCHENKQTTSARSAAPPMAMLHEPATLEPESWGSGYVDYPTMVQPILDKYCVRCHGGPEGIAKGLDFSGGWTWAFNISYETLIKHRMVGYLNCENGSVHTSEILPPRTIGSGAAPLAEVLITKHPEMSRAERDLIFAWMDTNSNYYGTWDYTENATCNAIMTTRGPLSAAMEQAGCTECHAKGHIGNDWVNLQTPEHSRILRAPMAKSDGGLGVAFCRNRKAKHGYPLVDQSQQPPDVKYPTKQPGWNPSGEEHVTFASTDDSHYQQMLAVIREARTNALAKPRVDMPGAEITPGEIRIQVPPQVPDFAPPLAVRLRSDCAVEISWPRTGRTIGLEFELHRSHVSTFVPDDSTLLMRTTAGRFVDSIPPIGKQHYALLVAFGRQRSLPAMVSIDVPQPPPPAMPTELSVRPLPGEVILKWKGSEAVGVHYDIYRASAGAEAVKVNAKPVLMPSYSDLAVQAGAKYAYSIRAIDRRAQQSPSSDPAEATPLPEVKEPVFATNFQQETTATLLAGESVRGQLQGGAKIVDGVLELSAGGFVTFEHLPEFELNRPVSVECWFFFDRETQMPVVVASGGFGSSGWFLQRFGDGWRWYLGGVSCDGGSPVVGRWVHLVGTFNGRRARLYQDGKQVAALDCTIDQARWPGPLVIGQYSSQGPGYQVLGRIAGVNIYRRALRPNEVTEKFQAGVKK